MAKILYEVKQNKNDKSSAFGKWFAQIKTLETLISSREFLKKAEFINIEQWLKSQESDTTTETGSGGTGGSDNTGDELPNGDGGE